MNVKTCFNICQQENEKDFELSIHVFVVLLQPVVHVLDVETLLQKLCRHTCLLQCERYFQVELFLLKLSFQRSLHALYNVHALY